MGIFGFGNMRPSAYNMTPEEWEEYINARLNYTPPPPPPKVIKLKSPLVEIEAKGGPVPTKLKWNIKDRYMIHIDEIVAAVEASIESNEERGIFVNKDGSRSKPISFGPAHVDFNPSECILDLHTHPMGGWFSGIDDEIDTMCPGHVNLLVTESLPIHMRCNIALVVCDWYLVGRLSLGRMGFLPLLPDEVKSLIVAG